MQIDGLMHKKIKWWITLIVFILIFIIAAWGIRADALFFYGGEIETTVPPAICSNPDACVACFLCGCGDHWQVTVKDPPDGSAPFVCPASSFGFIFAPPAPGLYVLGFGLGPWLPIFFMTTP